MSALDRQWFFRGFRKQLCNRLGEEKANTPAPSDEWLRF